METLILTDLGLDREVQVGAETIKWSEPIPPEAWRARISDRNHSASPKVPECLDETWHENIRNVLLATGRAMTAAEIAEIISGQRGNRPEEGRDRRFVMRCVGSTLSRYRGKPIDAKYLLVSLQGDAGYRYRLQRQAAKSRRRQTSTAL